MSKESFLHTPVEKIYLPARGVSVAYRRLGEKGDSVLFLHGWPLWGATFREVAERLSTKFTCYVPDLPGGGDTEWSENTDFSWPGQAETVRQFVQRLGVKDYYLVGQNSGAMIARSLALSDGNHIKRLAMTNTEIPHVHPWLWKLIRWSTFGGNFAHGFFRRAFRWPWFMRSRLGFGDSFYDLHLIDGEFRKLFLQPLFESKSRMEGHFRFIQGWSWAYLDEMEQLHSQIRVPTLLIWGEDDPILRVEHAEKMVKQFHNARLERVKKAKLFVQEERPEKVAELILNFFR